MTLPKRGDHYRSIFNQKQLPGCRLFLSVLLFHSSIGGICQRAICYSVILADGRGLWGKAEKWLEIFLFKITFQNIFYKKNN